MLTTALLPQSAPLEPMHAQYVPVLTDIAPLLLIRELPQDEYPTPALPRPFTSHDVEPVMFGRRTSQGIFVSQTLATTQAIQAFFHRLSVAVPGAGVPLDMRTLGIGHIFGSSRKSVERGLDF